MRPPLASRRGRHLAAGHAHPTRTWPHWPRQVLAVQRQTQVGGARPAPAGRGLATPRRWAAGRVASMVVGDSIAVWQAPAAARRRRGRRLPAPPQWPSIAGVSCSSGVADGRRPLGARRFGGLPTVTAARHRAEQSALPWAAGVRGRSLWTPRAQPRLVGRPAAVQVSAAAETLVSGAQVGAQEQAGSPARLRGPTQAHMRQRQQGTSCNSQQRRQHRAIGWPIIHPPALTEAPQAATTVVAGQRQERGLPSIVATVVTRIVLV